MKVRIDYPDKAEELEILRRKSSTVEPVTAVASQDDLEAARAVVAQVRMEGVIEEYIVSLVQATRPGGPSASPVASQLIEVGRVLGQPWRWASRLVRTHSS